MRKKMLAFVLSAALLCGGAILFSPAEDGGRVRAAEAVSGGDASGGSGAETATRYPAPVNVKLGENYTVTWDFPKGINEEETSMRIELYTEDGERLDSFVMSVYLLKHGYEREYSFAPVIDRSGNYSILLYLTDGKALADSDCDVARIDFTYTRPSKALVTPTPTWSETEPGKLSFPEVEGAVSYNFAFCKKRGDEWAERSFSQVPPYGHAAPVTEFDFRQTVNRLGEGQYRFRVKAVSGNIDEIANGEVVWSEILDTRKNAEDVAASVDSAINANPDNAYGALEALKGMQEPGELRTAMQTDAAVLDKIRALEDSYRQQQGIKVLAPAVSRDAAEYVDAAAISVVGAAFNAAQNSGIGLQVSVPENEVAVSGEYGNYVQLEIKLLNDGQSKGKLDMPVTITMPVPSGLDPSDLVILHIHADGTQERIMPLVSVGKATFTVIDFSTFVFANGKKEQEDVPSGDVPSGDVPSGDVASPSAPAQPVILRNSWANAVGAIANSVRNAPEGATVVIRKSDNISTLTGSVMQALADRKTVSLQMEYSYQGIDHAILILAGRVILVEGVDYYGPLYLLSLYGEMKPGGADEATEYTIVSGDTLSRIAAKNGTTVKALLALNPQIRDANRIYAGKTIRIQ